MAGSQGTVAGATHSLCVPIQDAKLLSLLTHFRNGLHFLYENKTTAKTLRALNLLFTRYGIYDKIVLDKGPQSPSNEFETFSAKLGIEHLKRAPGHPQSNGQAKRHVDIVKTASKNGMEEE